MAENKNINFQITFGAILKVAVVIIGLILVYLLQETWLIILIAILLAAVIEPLVDWLEKYRLPRGLSVILIYIVAFLLVFLMIELLIPPITEQVSLLVSSFPGLWDKLMEHLSTFRQFSEDRGLADNIQQGLSGLQAGLQTAASGVYNFFVSVLWALLNLIVVLTIAYYLVVQKDYAEKVYHAVAPNRDPKEFAELVIIIKKKIGDWARGQLLLSLIIGIISFAGLIFLIPKYALILALVAALTEIVPYIGPIIGAIPAVFLGLALPPFSPWRGLAVIILYVIIQQLENMVIVPQVMKKTVGMRPVTIIIVMLIGAQLAGIIGLILSIPLTAVIGIAYKYFVRKMDLSRIREEAENN